MCHRCLGRIACGKLHLPRFDAWGVSFTVCLNTAVIPLQTFRDLLADAGSKIGVGAFRPAYGFDYGRFNYVLTILRGKKS